MLSLKLLRRRSIHDLDRGVDAQIALLKQEVAANWGRGQRGDVVDIHDLF